MEPDAGIFEEGSLSPEDATCVLWEGADPVVLQAIREELHDKSIPFIISERHAANARVLLGLPKKEFVNYEVRVGGQNFEDARKFVSDITSQKPRLCPLCKSEFYGDDESCEYCNCALVGSRTEVAQDPPVLLWRGTDEAFVATLCMALRDSGIPYVLFETPEKVQVWWADRSWMDEKAEYVVRVLRGSLFAVAQLQQFGGQVNSRPENAPPEVFVSDGADEYLLVKESFERNGLHPIVFGGLWHVPPEDEIEARRILDDVLQLK